MLRGQTEILFEFTEIAMLNLPRLLVNHECKWRKKISLLFNNFCDDNSESIKTNHVQSSDTVIHLLYIYVMNLYSSYTENSILISIHKEY